MAISMILIACGGAMWLVLIAIVWLVTLPIRILLEPPEITHEEAVQMLMDQADELTGDGNRR